MIPTIWWNARRSTTSPRTATDAVPVRAASVSSKVTP